ncbi:MAG: sodium-independent anion transporter [Candidatus Omnitrophica bacterium CG11_big_fil_rev_8_21_14_0_20_45_26]|uniref:Sodium-independent anion transporter n=1 Tax=Candidatus Abzuiibacterium crystallinum TaxID=1974748 RepID=A0A2H0LMI4_9BACT|nr:MAG: sodium-independent anion transporter [Candidatus Omnitrophica bacterium CG11_big_fil_rev_8_21_14_0_20_45_26]PIW63752.1 MAG: sodium-independent anion transporter [Candidatus Omnitrophica bacterium CG12_big_fil_rev_8_21_14_0_65_45_16]
MLKPKLFTTLQNYSWLQFQADCIAGIIVGVVALPLAIAFAIASGVSPERGLFTAIVAGFLISALGGSRVQIGGPTGAFVVIVYGIVQKYGLDGLWIATMMGGVWLIIMGLCRFGSAVKFIPYPVIVGFTSGIALIIFSSQMGDFLGLGVHNLPASFLGKWIVYFTDVSQIDLITLSVGLFSLAIMIVWRRVSRRVPGPLMALLFSTLVAQWLHLPVETIGSRFGDIPHHLPVPGLPHWHNWEFVKTLIPVSMTIALLAGIESLLSAVISDGMIGGKHRPNMELIAQGIANICSPLFGGITATGAIARTTTNIHNGGRTPIAGIVHALMLLLVMIFFGKWAVLIPLSTLAAILMVVSYHMSEWHSVKMIMKSPKSDVAVMIITFLLTIFVDLTVAIQVGILLAVLLFIRRMAMVSNVGIITREFEDEDETDDPLAIAKRTVPKGVEVYEINGPFFFGASYKFIEAMNVVSKQPKVRIIRMRHVPAIDATGIRVLREECENARKNHIAFILSGVQRQPREALENAGILKLIGDENICDQIDEALKRSESFLSASAPQSK